RLALLFGRHFGPPRHECSFFSSAPTTQPGRGRTLCGEPVGHTIHVLGAFQSTDDLGAAVAEDVIVHRTRTLCAYEACHAIFARLSKEPDEGFFGRRLFRPCWDIVARLVKIK